jgi:O-antigen/teichoic acid export membrane protein
MFINVVKHILGRGSIILINQLSVLISIPILASRLDFLIFGQVAIAFVLVQLSWVISDWGIQHYSIEIWKRKKSLHEQNLFISTALSLRLFMACCCLGLILIVIVLNFLDISFLFWICLIPSIFFGGLYPLWFFQVKKIPQLMIIPTIFSRIAYLLIIFYFVTGNNNAHWALLAQGVNILLITLIAYIYMVIKHKFNFIFFSWKSIYSLQQLSRPYLINAIANNQINTLWGVGLSFVGGPVAMAIFNIGDQLYRLGGAITNIIAQSIRIYSIGENLNKLQFTLVFFVTLITLIVIVISLNSEAIISYFFKSEYYDAIQVVQVMIFVWGVHAVIKLLNYPVLGKVYGPAWVNKLTYKILILHIIIFVFWIVNYSSPISMAMAFGFVIVTQFLIFFYYFVKYHW